jgi:uncharacterized protein (DUF1501 family)
MQTLSDAVKTFFDDLQLMGLGDQVVACTFSEFGRCAKENGSFGTDHGTLAPMMVFGKNVKAGVSGTNPNLDNLTSDNQLKDMQFDYRQVFGTLLQDWLGANPYVMEEAMFDGYSKMKLIDRGIPGRFGLSVGWRACHHRRIQAGFCFPESCRQCYRNFSRKSV